MGSYRNDDEALVGLARQLTDAYGEARTREDQDYACESIAEYLAEFREAAPSEALLAILGLPLTAETYPLVDEAQITLAARGPAVAELLLAAALGDVYDPDGPASERAAETFDSMDPHEASLGLCEVLSGRGDDELKSAALDGLVALGGVAEPDLVVTLDDRVGGEWARAALEQLRYEREHAGFVVDEEKEAYGGGDEAEAQAGGDEADAEAVEAEAGDQPAGDSASAQDDGPVDEGATETGAEAPAGPHGSPTPDKTLVDDAYDEFLRRYEQESGGEPSSS
jgi:hypothetical protein